MPKPLIETLKLLQGGAFIEECADLLAETVKAVDETGKSGKLVITIDFKKTSGALAVSAKATNKVPEAAADADLLYATVEGNLTQSNPNQRSLDLRGVEAPPRVVREIDATTGEIRSVG